MEGASCLGVAVITQLELVLSTQAGEYREIQHSLLPSLPTHPPRTLGRGAGSLPPPQWHARAKGRLGFCPALDRSSSTWSKTSGDSNRLFVVKLCNLITNLWKRGGSWGRILTPRCVSAGAGTHCLPGPPQGSVPPGHSSPQPKPGHACNGRRTIYRTNIADN